MRASLLTIALASAAAAQQPTAITARHVFDGERFLPRATVVIDQGRIVSVGPRPASFAGAEYDLGDATLLPGLMDVHSHVAWYFNSKDRLHTSDDGDTPAQSMLAIAGNALATLMAGVTTIQSPGSAEDKDIRDAINRGVIPGPRILTSLGSLNENSGTPDSIRARVRRFKERGADVIKLFASQSIRDGGGPTMTFEQVSAACDEAHKLGLRVLVHAHAASAMNIASRAGCDQIEHGMLSDQAALDLAAQKGVFLSPQCSLVIDNYLENRRKFEGIGNYNEAGFAAMKNTEGPRIENIRRAVKTQGLRVVFGTDAVAGAHGRNWEELACRVQRGGQSVAGALASATSLAALSMRLADSLGAVRPGMVADLIAVPGDLSADIARLRTVSFVMKGGSVQKYEPARSR
jgi:imidazolonepropionase-like amidohydrolase